MKRILFVMFSVFSLSSFAQQQITIDVAPRPMSKDTQPSYLVQIPQTNLIQVEKDWLKYLSNGSKGKATVVNGENLQTGVVNKNISPNPLNVYSKLLETSEGIRLTVWLTESDTVFISKESNTDKDLAAQKYVRDFALAEYKDVVSDELKGEQNKLKALQKDLDALIKDSEKSGKKISESNRSIQKSNDNIATNNADIQSVSYKISDQKGMVERTAVDANANKGAKQTLKDLENGKKKLQDKNEAENKNIDSMNKTIREEERKIAELKEKQSTKTSQIEQQKQRVAEVQTKLDGIK